MSGQRDFPHELAERHHLGPGHDALDLDLPGTGGPVDDLRQLLEHGIADPQLEDEPVELSLGERIRPLHLDGVLGGEDEEGRGQRMPRPRHGDIALLHALEEGRLRLGRGAIHLVGEQDVAEDGAPLELEVLPPARILRDDVGADDVAGHQVGRELDPREGEVQALRQGLDQERLAQPRHPFQEHVAAGEEPDEDLVHHVVVADDHLLHLRPERPERLDEGLDALLLSSGRLRGLRHEEPLSRNLTHHMGGSPTRQPDAR